MPGWSRRTSPSPGCHPWFAQHPGERYCQPSGQGMEPPHTPVRIARLPLAPPPLGLSGKDPCVGRGLGVGKGSHALKSGPRTINRHSIPSPPQGQGLEPRHGAPAARWGWMFPLSPGSGEGPGGEGLTWNLMANISGELSPLVWPGKNNGDLSAMEKKRRWRERERHWPGWPPFHLWGLGMTTGTRGGSWLVTPSCALP